MMSDNLVPGGKTGIRYLEAYSYAFESKNWVLNILFVLICNFIPIVGPLVILGYQYEIVESLHRNPRRVYPDFDFNRFLEYLMRGLWPFLASLIVGLATIPVLAVFVALGFAAVAAAGASGGEEAAVVGLVVTFIVCMLLYMAYILFLHLVLMPMNLAAGLTQQLGAAFRFSFIRDFLGRVWVEMLLAMLFMVVSSTILMVLGMLACYIGMFPAIVLVALANGHMSYQLYELYLGRGGEPLPLKANSLASDIPPQKFEPPGDPA